MAYKENEVVAKYTKGNSKSDCGKYNVNDLLEMFDQAEITVDEYGSTNGVTVNDCTEVYQSTLLVTEDLVVTSESDDMFCYLNKDTVLQNEIDLEFIEANNSIINPNNEIPCSKELDYEFYYQSI